MIRRSLLYLVVLAGCAASRATASDWPTYMRDRTRVGYTDETLPVPLHAQWVIDSPVPPRRAWPGPEGRVIEGLKLKHRVRFDDAFHVAVARGSVFFGSSVDNAVHCVNASTGEEIWSYVTGGPIRLAPTYAEGRVYAGSDDGHVYCLDAAEGTLVWQRRAGPADERILARGRMTSRWAVRTGVLVLDGVAYFGAGIFPHETVYLFAVRADNGDIIWKNDTISQRDAGRNDLSPQGYLLATDTTLFVPSGRSLPAAVDRQSGALLHKQQRGGKQIGGTDALLDEGRILSVGEHHILALQHEDGGIVDRLQGRRMTFHDNRAYVADGEQITCIDRRKFAAVADQRVALVETLSGLQRELRINPAPLQLQRLQRMQQKIAAAVKIPAPAAPSEGSEKDDVATWKRELPGLKALYETNRGKYQETTRKIADATDALARLTRDGVLWRTSSPHQSALVLAGRTLVVGGVDQVAVLDSDTGQPVWNSPVEGEVRGLAVADGRLLASTTEGKIVCFSGDAPPSDVVAHGTRQAPSPSPFADDEVTGLVTQAADQILARSGVRDGYCLVYGNGDGRLAHALATRSNLIIYALDNDPARVASARAKLGRTGLYGHRISVDLADVSGDPYSDYFADLIVSETLLFTGQMPRDPAEVARHLKPERGVLLLGWPASAPAAIKQKGRSSIASWIQRTGLTQQQASVEQQEDWHLVTRGGLPGAAGWTHQYGNPGNTASVDDQRVRGGVQVLWYGDPGPGKMVNRHFGAAAPLSAEGRLFVQGEQSLMAYDAFNGRFLWERENAEALRTGVYQNNDSSNLALGDERLFMVVKDECLELDPATGETIRVHQLEQGSGDEERFWGYVGTIRGKLIGTSTVRSLLAVEARYRGRTSQATSTDRIFAVDVASGNRQWTYQGRNIAHATIGLDDQRVFFVDSTITPEQRERLLREDKTPLRNLTGEARRRAEDRMKRLDVRRVVALDLQTGDVLWDRAVDVTDCSDTGTGAGRLTLIVAGGHVMLCGANANGHYWKQFLAGEFKRRRLVTLSAETGEQLWAVDANYRHRPVVVNGQVIAEPWAFDLHTGAQQMRVHPLTGEKTPWKFIRPGHHCGAISATPGMLFFRSGYTAFYNLETDDGTQHFAGHRLGCWINTIPANGLVMIPEASAGCACLFTLSSTVVFEPRESREVWGVYTAEGSSTPVRHLALNLGAPGDRRDARGKLWLSYPRPSSRQGLDLPLEIRPLSGFETPGEYFQHNTRDFHVEGTDVPWIYASGMLGITHCELPLRGPHDGPAEYDVRLYFAAPDGDVAGQRVFSVKLQNEVVAEKIDLAAQSDGRRRAIILAHDGVSVHDDLVVDLVSRTGRRGLAGAPVLCAIEALQTGKDAILKNVVARRVSANP